MNARRCAVLCIASVLVAGCGSASTSLSSPSPSLPPAPRTSTYAAAAVPVQQNQLGMAHPAWADDEYELPESLAIIDQIAGAGLGWVDLSATWYQPSITASAVAPNPDDTVRDDGIRAAVQRAHARGLKVMFTPYVNLPDDTDRATIKPANVDAWFASYSTMVGHYADLAQSLGVEQFVTGAELTGTSTHESEWRAVVADVRTRFHGPVIYAANFDEVQQVKFWDAVDAIGVDAYYPLSMLPTHDVNALVGAWKPYVDALRDLSQHFDRPVVVDEIGYPSQRGATVEPWNYEYSATRDDEEQQAAYEAVRQAVWMPNAAWLKGVHFWMAPDIPGRSEDRQELDYTPFGKPAESVIRQLVQEPR